ncbi:uncharacterized protein LOC142344333 [Convolutriloba macropyga]|uniref:uncharacterized protein LOC142344333 n=1 Tax=Convolutriloba macropyga TaxID=536237 RepID=UPI003F526320
MFGCKNFGDNLMLYLKTDVTLLADVFEKCLRLFDQVYGLDPCHYYSAPNISWDAMLKTTKVKLDLLSDIDMLLFCERAIRGGLNGIGEKRYMKANNKYLNDFDEGKPSTYGLFLDVVNLYGGTMMKKLPTGGFEWSDISLDKIMQTSDESDVGYFVMVDLNYPSNLHDCHNDFPLAAEKLKIDAEMLSQYQVELGNKTSHIPKLLETLQSKQNYVCHHSVLKFYCQQGLQVTRLHKTLKFNQSDFMKCYIEHKVATTTRQKEIRWNKPTYLGAAILDLSKLHLYRFHYEEMGPLFDIKARVMYRDTDSLFYEIETDDIYEDLKQLKHKVTQSAKGVSKHVKKTLHHDKFKDVLKSKSPFRKLLTSITSDKHTHNITESNEIALSAFDNKRYYLGDGISSYAYGHYKIGHKRKQPSEKPQKSYIEISECETTRYLTEQLDTEIEETFPPPDPGFWKTSQIESDEEEIFDFDAAPKEKPFSRCPYIDFEAE